MGRGCSRYHPIWRRHAAGPASDTVRENPFSCRRSRKSTPDMLAPTSLCRNGADPFSPTSFSETAGQVIPCRALRPELHQPPALYAFGNESVLPHSRFAIYPNMIPGFSRFVKGFLEICPLLYLFADLCHHKTCRQIVLPVCSLFHRVQM